MLRVGLTGGLGSGKSTAARMFAAHGALVLSSDEIGRALMQPGEQVYAAIVARFGKAVVAVDGSLARAALARIAFGDGSESSSHSDGSNHIEELNAIVHPAVIARQAELIAEIAARDPSAIVIVESALIFETKHGGESGWHKRFDKIVFVKASEDLKIARFIQRASHARSLNPAEREQLGADARRRLANQADSDHNAALSDYVLINNGPLDSLQQQVDVLWPELLAAARERA